MRKLEFKLLVCDCLLGGLAALYLAVAYLVIEYRLPYIPVCPLFLITGRPCPLCGSTRMIGGYFHGVLEVGWSGLPPLLWFTFVVSVVIVSAVRVVTHLSEQRHLR